MRTAVKSYLPAMTCAATLLACYFLVRPYAEIGLMDDWSYVRAAQKLAQTGHITYGGAETPMLGWQLFLGSLFVRLFGFSFTAVRFATVIEAMATTLLLERIFERTGLSARNATLATLAFVLSPIYLPYVFTFMTDVSGVLCIALCLYLCLRALQAESERSAAIWICLAALGNAVGGTARQFAWLGLLVMVPSALWLLKKRRLVLAAGCISWIIGVVFMMAAMRWFAHQPYTASVPLALDEMNWQNLKIIGRIGLDSAGELLVLAFPVLLMFAEVFRSWNRRVAAVFATGMLGFVIPSVVLLHFWRDHWWLANLADGYMIHSTSQRLSAIAAHGLHFAAAREVLRILLTGVVLVSALCLVASFFVNRRRNFIGKPAATPIPWVQLWILLGPFSAACVLLLALIIPRFGFADRYLLPLLVVLLLILARTYQERWRERLPWVCALLIVLFGAYSVTATHDEFALYRGYADAIGEIESNGVPATAILGPWEYLGWTELEAAGYVDDSRIRVPAEAYVPQPQRVYPASCDLGLFYFLNETPAIKPAYVVTRDAGACGGMEAFPPVAYRTWVAPRVNAIYSVRLPPPFPY